MLSSPFSPLSSTQSPLSFNFWIWTYLYKHVCLFWACKKMTCRKGCCHRFAEIEHTLEALELNIPLILLFHSGQRSPWSELWIWPHLSVDSYRPKWFWFWVVDSVCVFCYSVGKQGPAGCCAHSSEARDLPAFWRQQCKELQPGRSREALRLHPSQISWYAQPHAHGTTILATHAHTPADVKFIYECTQSSPSQCVIISCGCSEFFFLFVFPFPSLVFGLSCQNDGVPGLVYWEEGHRAGHGAGWVAHQQKHSGTSELGFHAALFYDCFVWRQFQHRTGKNKGLIATFQFYSFFF